MENSMISECLDEFDEFIKYGSRGRNDRYSIKATTPRARLNFSEAEDDETREVSIGRRRNQDSDSDYVKKHAKSVIGLDVCRVLEDKEKELVECRAQITSLKGEITSANYGTEKQKLDYESELTKLRQDQLRNFDLIADLNSKLRREKKESEDLRSEKCRISYESNKELCALQNELSSIKLETVTSHTALQQKVSSLEESLEHFKYRLSDKTSELDLATAEIRNVRKDLNERIEKIKEMHLQLLEVGDLKIELNRANSEKRELQGRLDMLSSQEGLSEKFETLVRSVPDLKLKCSRLQAMNDMYQTCSANTILLEEQVASATDEIKQLREGNKEFANLQAELDFTKTQFSELASVIRSELSLAATPTPDVLSKLLKNLRRQDKELTDGIKAMKESISCYEKELSSLQTENKTLKEEKEEQNSLQKRQVQLVRRNQRKLILIGKERDSLKEILTSYETENTMTAAAVTGSARLSKLEADLSLYKQEMAKLEEELDEYQRAPKLHGDEEHMSRSDKEELRKLSAKVTELTETISKLEGEKEVLEYRLDQRAAQGDYDPTKAKVVHLKLNPMDDALSQYKDEVTKLEEEVKVLKEQLAKAHQGNVSVIEPVVKNNDEEKRRIEELEKERKTMEIKNVRMLEVFKKKYSEFKEVVYRILGYKLTADGNESNCYKLSSMYAESPDHYFMFKYTDDGEIQLLETEFSNSLDEFIDEYLANSQVAYPAFTAAITTDLYNKQTIMYQPGPSTSYMGNTSQGVRRKREEEDVEEEERMEKKRRAGEEEEEEEEVDEEMEDELVEEEEEEEGEEEEVEDEERQEEEEQMNSDSDEEERRRVRAETDRREESEGASDSDEENERRDSDTDREEYAEEEEEEEEEEEQRYQEMRQAPPPQNGDDSDDDLICLD